MLVPITKEKLKQLIPVVATGNQYLYTWGKLQDFLRRLIFSIVGIVVISFPLSFIGHGAQLVTGLMSGFYWLWGPAVIATFRNRAYRRYPYAGFWQGQVLDVFVSEELIGKEENVDQRGQLVIIENRERCLNLEVGDKTGFFTPVRSRLRRQHRVIRPGDVAQMILFSRQPDLSEVDRVSDVYLPQHQLWVGDYPCLQRDVFEQIRQSLRRKRSPKRRSAPPSRRSAERSRYSSRPSKYK